MRSNLRTNALCLLICLVAAPAAFPQTGVLPELPTGPLTVKVASGRQFTGRTGARSDAQWLWLRSELAGGYIARPIRWDRVTEATWGQTTYTADELLALVSRFRDRQPAQTDPRATADSADTPSSASVPSVFAAEDTRPERHAREEIPRVVSVAVEAWAANWDGDSAIDGLVLEIRPLGRSGATVPVTGSVEATLVQAFSPARGRSRPVERLGRWVRQVHPDDFGYSGAQYQLSYQRVPPSWGAAAGVYGLLHVRLSVAGWGVFESTVDTVRLRSWSPTRDAYQQSTGRRRFPWER